MNEETEEVRHYDIFMRPSVLVLGDASSAAETLYEILHRGCTPLVGPVLSCDAYVPFDELRQYSAVLVLPGDIYPTIQTELSQALLNYVKSGGIVVATPFLAWSVQAKNNHSIDQLIPVTCVGSFFEAEWAQIRLDTIASGSSIDKFTVPRIIEVEATSGELLAAKEGATVHGFDVSHSVPAVISWQIEKGAVAYINVSHHSHDDLSGLGVWMNDLVQDILFAFLHGCVDYSPALGIRGWGGDPDDDSLLHSTGQKYRECFRYPAQSSEIEMINDFYSRSHGFAPLGPDGRMTSHFYSRSLIESVPQCPYVHIRDADYQSMTFPEKVYVCRSLLDVLSSDVKMYELFSGDTYGGSAADTVERYKNQWKGRALEVFARFLFMLLPGSRVHGTNVRTPTGEIDLLVACNPTHAIWNELGSPFFVECKCLSGKVDSQAVRVFIGKMDEHGVRSGIIISKEGVAGKSNRDAVGVIRNAKLKRGLNVISMSFEQLSELLKYHKPLGYLSTLYYDLYSS